MGSQIKIQLSTYEPRRHDCVDPQTDHGWEGL
jgi:hypothetical protein